MRETEIAVVGAGPAGIAAALAASRAGAQVTVVDEYSRPGGQIYRQPPEVFHVPDGGILGKEHRKAQRLFRQLAGSPVELLPETLVWGVQDEMTLLLYREGGEAETLRAEAIVVAAGAYDRPIAFPGWTLPGVWTAGGTQAMLKSQRVLPGRRVLVAGAGPLLLPLAAALAEAGATVVGMVEATTRLDVRVFPRKGQIVVVEKAPRFVRRKLMEAAYTSAVESGSAGLQVAMVAESTRSGTLLLGSSRELVGYDRSVSPRVAAAITARALRFFPSLAGLRSIRNYAGLRPFSPDHLPLIGPLSGAEGFYVATGHEGAGIGLAPATGRLIAQWVTGQTLDFPAGWFSPDRFQKQEA